MVSLWWTSHTRRRFVDEERCTQRFQNTTDSDGTDVVRHDDHERQVLDDAYTDAFRRFGRINKEDRALVDLTQVRVLDFFANVHIDATEM